MTVTCRRRDTCRLCGSSDLVAVLSLEPTPPANAFVAPEDAGAEQQRFPLDVHLCRGCSHLQLLDVVDPGVLFEDYVYVSGTSPVFVKHFEDYAEALCGRFRVPPGGLVVDIGSNDGTLLAAFKERGMTVLGVDPARHIATAASARGIETVCGFFTPELARSLAAERGAAAVVTANNVFAHADDLAGMVEGVRALLAPDGVFVFEVSYLVDVYQGTLFDTIYHEHLDYHSVKPLRAFFAGHGMELFAARRVATHGGSLRGFVQPLGGRWPGDGSIDELVALEERLGLDRAETFHAFGRRIQALGKALKDKVSAIRSEGGTIAGFGAPAKATTLMYQFGIGPETIDFIVDDSPLKQGLLTPGHHIEVLPAEALYERRPDYLIVLAWNFAGPIMDKHASYQRQGGRFIVPLPQLEIH